MKKKMTFREWAKQPYTKGDYYGSIAVILGLYGLAFGGCLLYDKLTDSKTATIEKELTSDTAETIRVGCMEETKEDEA